MTEHHPVSGAGKALAAPRKFTKLRMHNPYENLATAIGLIQSHILATDSAFSAGVMFGDIYNYSATSSLEAAVAMLVPLVEEVEDLSWGDLSWEDHAAGGSGK